MKKILIAALLMSGLAFSQTYYNPVAPSSIPTVIVSEAGDVISATAPGSDQACDDGARHFTEINIPYPMSVTGIWYLVGSVGGTDSVALDLYTSAGVLVTGATTTVAGFPGAIVGTAAQVQSDAFTGGAVTVAAGKYFISAQFTGTTAKFRSPTVTGLKYICDEDAGTVGTPASITPGTAYVADKGII